MVQFSVKTLLIAVAVVSAFLAGWQWGRVEHAYDSLYYTRERARWAEKRRELEGTISDLNAELLVPVPPPLPRVQNYFK